MGTLSSVFLGDPAIKECLKLKLRIYSLMKKIRGLEIRVLDVLIIKSELWKYTLQLEFEIISQPHNIINKGL